MPRFLLDLIYLPFPLGLYIYLPIVPPCLPMPDRQTPVNSGTCIPHTQFEPYPLVVQMPSSYWLVPLDIDRDIVVTPKTFPTIANSDSGSRSRFYYPTPDRGTAAVLEGLVHSKTPVVCILYSAIPFPMPLLVGRLVLFGVDG